MMTRFEIVLVSLITAAATCLMVALLIMARATHAHEPCTGKIDPVFKNGCCGGTERGAVYCFWAPGNS